MNILQNNFFISYNQIPLNAVTGEYQPALVFLSYLVAALASYAVMYILQRINPEDKKSISNGRLLSSIIMGTGIWSMHFTGMLAHQMKMVHSYNIGLTLLSMLPVIIFSYAGFYNLTIKKLSLSRILLSALLMGLGIALMHYIGMAAMEMEGEIKYLPDIFVLSVFISVAASAAAMWIMYFVIHSKKYKHKLHIIAALVMGLAICAMHYTGMRASIFIPFADCRFDSNQSHVGLAVTIVILSISIIATTILLSTRSIVKEGIVFSKHGFAIGSFYIALICGSISIYIYFKSENEYSEAVSRYRDVALEDYKHIKETIEHEFEEIYSNLRIITNLPSISSIERHASNLSSSDRATIQEIYNNLVRHVKISEIYIIPKDFNPDAIDPETGMLESPIITFDDFIVGRTGSDYIKKPSSPIEEIEIYEYHLIKEQIAWLKRHYPTIGSIDRIGIPAMSGREVITCDNSLYSPSTTNDADRSGLVYSMPFYDKRGEFKGVVSAIFLTSILQRLLPNGNYALLNLGYHQQITRDKPSQIVKSSKEWIDKGAANPNLLYSEIIPLSIIDGENNWKLWIGISNSSFVNSIGSKIIKERYFEYAIIFLIGSGAIVTFYLFRRNYLQEKLEQEKLEQESEKRFSIIANSMPCLLWTTDASGARNFFNKTWCDFTGYSTEQGLCSYWVENIHRDDVNISMAKYREAIKEQKSFELSYRLKRRDGEYRWMLVLGTARFTKDKKFDGFIVTCTDISESRKFEEKLFNTLQELQTILNTVVDGIITIDAKGIIHEFNPAAEKMFGYNVDEVVGKNINILMPEPYHKEHDGYLANYTRTGKAKVIGIGREVFGKRKDESVFPMELGVSEFKVDDKKIFVGIIKDITDRKRSDVELMMHRNHLQELVELQTKDIVIQKEKAEKLSLAKSEFLSNMSHELRTPMHAILNYASMGLKNIGKDKPEKLEKYIGNIQMAGNRLLGLLNNLLDLAKMDSGKMDFTIEDDDFNDVLEYAKMEIESLLKEKNITISTEIINADAKANFDKLRMIQVIINLFSNAIKFSPTNGTIQVTLSEYLSFDDKSYLLCKIADMGHGIPAAELESIFDKFIQSSKTKTGAGGTGLGLSICKEIIVAHGGEVWAENGENGGAVFSFLIPK